MKIWKEVSAGFTGSVSFQGQLDDWFAENLRSNKLLSGNIPNYLLFSCVLWFMWKWRCNLVFDSNFSPPQFSHLVVTQFAKDWASANAGIIDKKSCLLLICWVPPGEGWVKLNIDGSCDTGSGSISAGGVIRNHWKNWVKGFVMNKGVGSVIEAELWGMFEGLTMAWNAGVRRIIVETDSLDSVQLVSTASNPNHPFFSLIQSCKFMVDSDWVCIVQHVYREGNRLADGLAHLGHSMKNEIMFFEDPPPQIFSIYEDDCKGLGVMRQCAAPVSLVP